MESLSLIVVAVNPEVHHGIFLDALAIAAAPQSPQVVAAGEVLSVTGEIGIAAVAPAVSAGTLLGLATSEIGIAAQSPSATASLYEMPAIGLGLLPVAPAVGFPVHVSLDWMDAAFAPVPPICILGTIPAGSEVVRRDSASVPSPLRRTTGAEAGVRRTTDNPSPVRRAT